MKDGQRVELVKNCPDNPYAKKGMQGLVFNDFNHDGFITIQFDSCISGELIASDKYNTWNVKPEFLKVVAELVQDQKFTCAYCGKEISTNGLQRYPSEDSRVKECYCTDCYMRDSVER